MNILEAARCAGHGYMAPPAYTYRRGAHTPRARTARPAQAMAGGHGGGRDQTKYTTFNKE
jgi:hypothetical protein